MAATHLATTREVATAIASLGFQPTNEILGAIARNCRDEFLNHLSCCIAGQDEDGASKRFVGNLLACLSAGTIERLKRTFPDATLDMIVPVAKRVPTRFLSAIDATDDPAHPRHADARAYLASICTPAQSASDNAVPQPTGHEQRGGYGDNPAPEQAQPSRREGRPGAGGKEYHSVHVYGSNAALCFNANEWNGAPGVMVDAAMQTGPKTYDWKHAVHVWLDTNEVGAVLAVLRRWRSRVEFVAHGAQNDKTFTIELQKQHFFARVCARKASAGAVRAVKIMPTDATAVSMLFLTQLARSYPTIPLNELLETVRATHQMQDAAPV